MFENEERALIWRQGRETLRIEAWGEDALRIRATRNSAFSGQPGALLPPGDSPVPEITLSENQASLRNGKIEARVTSEGRFSILDQSRDAVTVLTEKERRYVSRQGGLFRTELTLAAQPGERLYGMGQRQHGLLDQKGCVLELHQRNTEVSIPFLVSSLGYGFLWNSPSIGRAEFAANRTRWIADAAQEIDCWITVGEASTVLARYADATGHAPPLPDWALGFWQSRLRYASQEELLSVAREHCRHRELPLSVLVIDALHWTAMGDSRFDPTHWPDPAAMVRELREMGIEPAVSVWPAVSLASENYPEMKERGFLVEAKRGNAALHRLWDVDTPSEIYVHNYDATHPDARRFLWRKVRENYYRYGIRLFWLDANEPEMPEEGEEPESNLLYYAGDGDAVHNLYANGHVQAFSEGLTEAGEAPVLMLARALWAGGQRYGAAVWSGDIAPTWDSLRAQVRAGLNMGLSGVPYWTSDIGGFRGGDPSDSAYRELVVRWFQFGAFCPLFRLHGARDPSEPRDAAPNEVWSYGEEAYAIFRQYLFLRERLRPYLESLVAAAHSQGTPLMRPLFFEFPRDSRAWEVEDAYLFGPDLLVAPVLEPGATARKVYLPEGAVWRNAWTGAKHPGGQTVLVSAPPERIPLFLRNDADLPIQLPPAQ